MLLSIDKRAGLTSCPIVADELSTLATWFKLLPIRLSSVYVSRSIKGMSGDLISAVNNAVRIKSDKLIPENSRRFSMIKSSASETRNVIL